MPKAQKIKKSVKKWVDESFLANTNSITSKPNASNIANAKLLKWRHYS